MSSHLVNWPHQRTEANTFKKDHHSDTVHSCTFDTDCLQVYACSVVGFLLCGISGPVNSYSYIYCQSEGEAGGEEGAVWECEDYEEAQESWQALLGQVSN